MFKTIALAILHLIRTIKLSSILSDLIDLEKNDIWLWIPVFFGFGVAFYLVFEAKFLAGISVFIVLFVVSIISYYLNRNSPRSLVFIALILFLIGGFYSILFQKTFLKQTQISGRVFADSVGKVESIKVSAGSKWTSLVISDPILYKTQFLNKKKAKNTKNRSNSAFIETKLLINSSFDKRKIKKLINITDYQEIDRKFLDYSNNYQRISWVKDGDREKFPNPPQKISISLKNAKNIAVNDIISVRVMLQPIKLPEFRGDFDFKLYAKFKKIGAYGFAISEAKILSKAQISGLDEWFLSLREVIRTKVSNILEGDSAAISLALLIGDKSQISADLIERIRHSGLAHLLAISGFHLSLAAAICFICLRFAMSRSQYLALHFDLKNIATIFAILGAFFYLKIANSPLPAQRAFLMVFLAATALLLGKKVNANASRAVMVGMMALILVNPYAVFNISFQLSFAAILILGCFYDEKKPQLSHNVWRRFFGYFLEIIILSILIEIATAPFLMRSFQNVAMFGFVANVMAIPLTAFFVMPFGFFALFLMPIGLEKYALLAMEQGIFLIEKIVIFVTESDYSHFETLQLSGFGLILAIIGLLIICLIKTPIRFVGVGLFLISFATMFFDKKPDILFDGKQKFFAFYDHDNGLVFSKKLRASRKRSLWMKKMGEDEFKYLAILKGSETSLLQQTNCNKKYCLIEADKKILVILQRNKISEICQQDFDVIVNLTAKYKLPDCIGKDKMKIDNFDFYQKGGHFFYLKDDILLIKTTS